MKVINLFAGPGCGKSTLAAGLFYHMKCAGLEVELVQEYAKDMTWEQRFNVLEDQLYVFAKQQRRLQRLKHHRLQWVITDSPLPLGLCYEQAHNKLNNLTPLVWEVFHTYENHNFLIERRVPYNPVGRNQDVHQAVQFDQKIQSLLDDNQIAYTPITNMGTAINSMLSQLQLTVE